MAMVRDNPFVEELKQIWLQEGMQAGMQAGRHAGMQAGVQRDILETLELRFGSVPGAVRETVNRMDDEARLRDIHRRAVTCGSVDEFAAGLAPPTV